MYRSVYQTPLSLLCGASVGRRPSSCRRTGVSPGAGSAPTLLSKVCACLWLLFDFICSKQPLVRLQLLGFVILLDRFVLPGCDSALDCLFFFELFALRSFECVVTLEPWTTRHSAPAAVAKQGIPRIQRQYLLAIEGTPTRASRVSRSCQRRFLPSATWSLQGQEPTQTCLQPKNCSFSATNFAHRDPQPIWIKRNASLARMHRADCCSLRTSSRSCSSKQLTAPNCYTPASDMVWSSSVVVVMLTLMVSVSVRPASCSYVETYFKALIFS